MSNPNNIQPDWAKIEREVIRKLRYLRAAWEHTAVELPELHEAMKRDLYMPAMANIAKFCMAIQEEPEKPTSSGQKRISADAANEENVERLRTGKVPKPKRVN